MTAPYIAPSPQVAAALARNNKIDAIKLVREETGLGLKEARDLVESFAAQPRVTASREALTAAWSQTMQATHTEPADLAPGQQPSASAATGWWVGVGVAAFALATWLVLRG